MNKPFFFYSESLPRFLYENKVSIVFSTYQAGKVIFLSSVSGERLQMYAKNFPRPMGIALKDGKMAIANKSRIDVFSRSRSLAQSFPSKKKYYDTLFIPQVSYYTGMADIHEVVWGNNELWAVNTAFSCLCVMDERYSFIPKWKPDFITELAPEDRCHLNGLALKDGKPYIVSMFDRTNAKEGWRNGKFDTGLLINVENNEILADALSMPHSPVYDNGKLYFLQSATGKVCVYNIENMNIDVLTTLTCFTRGMDVYDDYLIVGGSKLRESSSLFSGVADSIHDGLAGIFILNKNTGEQEARITFTENISEIFSVHLIRNTYRPAIITQNDEEAEKFIMAAENQCYWVKNIIT